MIPYRDLVSRATIVILAGMLAACGAQTYRTDASASSSGSSSSSSNSSSSSSSTDTDDSTSTTNNQPTYSFYFENAGSGSTTFNDITTDDLLKVTVTLGQPTTIVGTGATANFTCAKLNVTVGGSTQLAFVTNTGAEVTWSGSPCYGAKPSVTLDFSSRLTVGHGAMTVKVTNVAYDNCRLYGSTYYAGCPLTVPYSTHKLTGTIDVVTNASN